MTKPEKQLSKKEVWELHKRCIRDIERYAPGTILSLILEPVVRGLSPYVTIYFSAQIINELAGLRRADVLWKWVLLTLCTGLLMNLLSAVLLRWKNANTSRYNPKKDLLFTHKNFDMDYADLDDQKVRDRLHQIKQNENWNGCGLNRVIASAEDLSGAVVGILGALVLTVSLFTSKVPESAGKLLVLNHPLFILLFLLLVVGVALLSGYAFSTMMKKWAENAEKATFGNRLFTAVLELHHNVKRSQDIRIYQQAGILDARFKKENPYRVGGYFDKVCRGPFGLFYAFSRGCSAILTGAAYVFVCLKATAGAFGIGSVTQYVSAITSLSRHLSDLLSVLGDIKNNIPFLQKTYEYLDIPKVMYQGSLTTEKRSDRQYEVEFRDVSFKYPGSERYSLRHVSVKFKVGQRLAVVGMNGSGKTTFIKLLCRLYDPTEGQILLNGIDIRKYRYDDYMDIFSVVFQDYQLLAQPLGANVAGSKHYDSARVTNVLRDAGFGDRLAAMPQGLDTMLYKDFSKEGVEVSGGEAQKIAIARALYKDAPFIILDEPTAALDPIAEAEIYSKFNEIAGDKTAIYISHRLSSCKFCDDILVFQDGSVIQQGNHASLLAEEGGKYHELWYAQAQYYDKKEEE